MSNVESFLRIHGAIPSDNYSSLEKTTDEQTEAKQTIEDIINRRSEAAEQLESDKEKNAKCFAHQKASTATPEQVAERTKALLTLMKEGGLGGLFTDAPHSVRTLINNFHRMQKKFANVCLLVVEESNRLNSKQAKSKFTGIARLKETLTMIAQSTSQAY